MMVAAVQHRPFYVFDAFGHVRRLMWPISRRDGLTHGNGRVVNYDYNKDSTLKQIKHAGLINDSGGPKMGLGAGALR